MINQSCLIDSSVPRDALSTLCRYLAHKAKLLTETMMTESLLNCFWREVVAKNNDYSILTPSELNNCPAQFKAIIIATTYVPLIIKCNASEIELMLAVHLSDTGHHRYEQPVYWCPRNQQEWMPIDGHELARLILQELSLLYKTPFNDELMHQIENSKKWQKAILENHIADKETGLESQMIRSEQGLLFGHPFHPTPKAREGWSNKEHADYAPEMKAKFKCHLYQVKIELVKQLQLSNEQLTDFSWQKLEEYFGVSCDVDKVLIPLHPWQSAWVNEQPLIQSLIAQGDIIYHGAAGPDWYPTSSVRTVMSADFTFALKLSLHIRMTNCVRKNAWYELENAVGLTKLLIPIMQVLRPKFPHFTCLSEPACRTVQMKNNTEVSTLISEAFGFIIRDISCLNKDSTVVLGSLFSPNDELGCEIQNHCNRYSGNRTSQYVTRWFEKFIDLFIPPLTCLYAQHGIILEPHMQNVLVEYDESGLPCHIYIRDMEGTKLAESTWHDKSLELEAKQVLYSYDQSWNRFVYCAFVNVISEMIAQFAATDLALEHALWKSLYHGLVRYQSDKKDNERQVYQALIQAEFWPAKGNLSVRFLKNADRAAPYFDFPNPVKKLMRASTTKDCA